MALIELDDLDALCFDFDGVLTDNRVFVSADGVESVRCNRADGLAFDALRKLKVPCYIISTESNPVVAIRARKLRVPSVQGASDKTAALNEIAQKHGYQWHRILFIGNDLNDFRAMEKCGRSACPRDSHPLIRRLATITLQSAGGQGVARELVEKVLGIDILETLFPA